MLPNDNLQQLHKLGRLFGSEKLLTQEDVQAILEALIKILANNKTSLESMTVETKQQVNDLFEKIAEEHYKLQQIVDKKLGMSVAEIDNKMEKMMSDCKALMEECRMAMPQNGMDGKDADEEKIVEDVLKKIKLPEYKDPILDTGEQIVAKINDLPIDDDNLKIDAKHIKGLPDLKDSKGKTVFTAIRGPEVQIYDLSSQLDGVTKTFALPAFRLVFDVRSSSFPYAFKPTTDYTTDGAAMTITFTDEITAGATLAAGQTLYVLYLTI